MFGTQLSPIYESHAHVDIRTDQLHSLKNVYRGL